jgi:hypothetical protein
VLAEPTLLDFPIGVRKIACGSTHTVALAGLIRNALAMKGISFKRFHFF